MSECDEVYKLDGSRSYVCFDGMSWPLPDADLEWQMRYAPEAAMKNHLFVASVMNAYRELILSPERRRNRMVFGLRQGRGLQRLRRIADVPREELEL